MLNSYALRLCAVVLFATALFAPRAHAQLGDDLSIYGFFQAQARYNSLELGGVSDQDLSFSIQQLNLFLANQYSPSFSSFVNAEIRNTLSTGDGFGELRLEEAWVRYNHSGQLNVKAGRLLPQFNNLNEIKNRTPLLPYVFRPIVYESSFARILNVDQFVPDQAYLQVYGALPAGEARVDYAAYVGNGDQTNLAPVTEGAVIAGSDTTLSKLVGGRLGVRWNAFKAGVSATHDQPQHTFPPIPGLPAPDPAGLGELNRTRIGGDLSFTTGPLFGEAEYIAVRYGLNSEQEAALAANPVTNELDATFYYALLGVNITDQWFAYGRYDYFKDPSLVSDAFNGYNVGAGYRPIDQVTLKAQYNRVEAGDVFSADYLFGAVSVSF